MADLTTGPESGLVRGFSMFESLPLNYYKCLKEEEGIKAP